MHDFMIHGTQEVTADHLPAFILHFPPSFPHLLSFFFQRLFSIFHVLSHPTLKESMLLLLETKLDWLVP